MALIDLHIHTTASDGLSSPSQLVAELQAADVGVFAVTDHDTVAGLAEVDRHAAVAGLTFVPGIEITAVDRGRDVHVLGYFVDAACRQLRAFLAKSREDRLRRGRLMCERLAAAGAPIEFEALFPTADHPASTVVVSRPIVADALVRAGHVSSRQEAFDRFLADGQPAYVARCGASPQEVVALIRDAGGLSSLAHPGVTARDDLIAPLVGAGLDAIECFHTDHTSDDTREYLAIAARHGLGVTGGSDYHGPGTRRADGFGRVVLPAEHYDDLAHRVGLRRSRRA